MGDSIPSSFNYTDSEEVLNKTLITDADSGEVAALIGGAAVAVLLLVTCVIGALLWCLSRHKGSYDTNETDGYVMGDDEEDEEDEELVGSDAVLQSKAPLEPKEEE